MIKKLENCVIQEDETTYPIQHGTYQYYESSEKNKEYRIYCRTKGEGHPEEILLDENDLAHGKVLFHLGVFDEDHA